MRALVPLLGRLRHPRCCMPVLSATKETHHPSNQVPKPPVPRQTSQHPFLLRLARPRLSTFTHQVFLQGGVWTHSCFHAPPLSDPFFPPLHVPKDRADKDCLGDLLCESVREWAG
jgi:hypothetical protein